MGNKIVDLKDARFVIYDQFNIEKLFQAERFCDHSLETVEMTINAAEKLAVNDFYPANSPGDKIGCVWENGKVTVPEVYRVPYQKFREAGWLAAAEEYEVGGQNLPLVVDYINCSLFYAANQSLMGYIGITHSAAKVIEVFGTPDQKRKYMLPLYEGRYGGGMNLTEPQAGSDVGAVRSKAKKNADGTYTITGTKIFITGGEQNLTENIVHILLARIEGDAEGTKGLSCFVVPKTRVNDDGTLGEDNDVFCTGTEHKLGMKGSATSSLAFGDNGRCIGELLGEQGKGIITMFHMMNEQRILVGLQGHSMGSAAYLHALSFARERKQGTAMGQKSGEQVAIIEHPDVRKNLLWMKCLTEGSRALILYTIYCMDLLSISQDKGEIKKLNNIIDVLTPICKAYSSEKGFEVCARSIQVHGGYGYCQEYLVEQLLRDCKITTIFEGTNGIQSNDLLGRKISMQDGAAFQTVISEIKATIAQASSMVDLSCYAEDLGKYIAMLQDISDQLLSQTITGQAFLAYSWATHYLEIFGDILLGWMFLWQAKIAHEKLNRIFNEKNATDKAAQDSIINNHPDATFLASKLVTAKFYLGSLLPAVTGKIEAIMKNDNSILQMIPSFYID